MTLHIGNRRALLTGAVSAGEAVTALALTATTVGAATVTIHRITPTGGSLTIAWGDGAMTVVAAGDTAAQAHAYAGAGTWSISCTPAAIITQLDLHDAKLSGFNSAQLAGSVLTYFFCYSLGSAVANRVVSADMAAWRPTYWLLHTMPAGTYNINSADLVAWRPTYWYLHTMPAGTYNIASADMAAWRPTVWYLHTMPAGTYTINFSDLAAWNPTTFYAFSLTAPTITIAAANLATWRAVTGFRVDGNALLTAAVDAFLAGLYGAFPLRTGVNGTINVGGTNQAPSGVYQAQCAPGDGKEFAYELLNDSCGVSANHWATVTYTA